MNGCTLVGDVGGTNTRLALCDIENGTISDVETFSTKEYPSLEAVVRAYLSQYQRCAIRDACIAIACPVTEDWIAMTNHNWAFSVSEMKRNLEFDHLEIINDFTAVSMAIPMLTGNDLMQFGGNPPDFKKPAVVLGAGTGLGVAHLIKIDKRWVTLPGEGGHVDFAANSDEEDNILAILRAEKGHVSAERILSGTGLVNLYHAIVKSDNRQPEDLQPEEVTRRACENSCLD